MNHSFPLPMRSLDAADYSRHGYTNLSGEHREELMVGLVYLTTSLLCLIPLLLILKLLATERDMRSNMSYLIMFHIGISDVSQLIPHIASAVFVFAQSTFHPLLNKVLGAVCNGAVLMMVPMNLVLAMNRFTVLCYRPSFMNDTFFHVLCGVVYLWGVAVTVCCLTSLAGLEFLPQAYVWKYDDGSLSNALEHIDFFSCILLAALSLLIYIVIVLKLIITKKLMHSHIRQQHRREIGILAQAILIFLYCSFFMFAWHFYTIFLPDSRWTCFAINVLWILNSGITSLLYLLMSKTLRTRFRVRYLARLRPRVEVYPEHAEASHRRWNSSMRVAERPSTMMA